MKRLFRFIVLSIALLDQRYTTSLSLVGSKTRRDEHSSSKTTSSSTRKHPTAYDFDLVIVGAGASGLFASAAASLFGKRVCLVEKSKFAGGDCTNAACVPSKALRSFSSYSVSRPRVKRPSSSSSSSDSSSPAAATFLEAQNYVYDTVKKVRARENPDDVEQRNSLLVYLQVEDCYFADPHTLNATSYNRPSNSTEAIALTSRNFIIATGASPVISEELQQSATIANLHTSTYQSFLRPEANDNMWHLLDACIANGRQFRLLVVGGGATACELSQFLGRLAFEYDWIQVIVVAPSLLCGEDVKLQEAASRILHVAGVDWIPGRVVHFYPDKSVQVETSPNETIVLPPVDAALLCVGRSPISSLESLRLDNGGITWNAQGVQVHPFSLQSISAPHVYAAGDCCDAVPRRLRTASHAAWTGFHAVRNIGLPSVLRLGDRASIHRNIPRVIYTDPEMACVGLTRADCILRYSIDGFDTLCAREDGTDRADMERNARDSKSGFVELRAQRNGRILGCTACGPAAAEICNSIGIAITNRLTVSDVALAAHSYPSHGYLLYRVALSMALGRIWGLLDACGPIGRSCSSIGRRLESFTLLLRRACRLPGRRDQARRHRQWQSEGATRALIVRDVDSGLDGHTLRWISYLELWQNSSLQTELLAGHLPQSNSTSLLLFRAADADSFLHWQSVEP